MSWFDVALFVVNPLQWYTYHRLTDTLDGPGAPRTTPADLQVPQVQEGTPVPLIYGTVRVKTPVMVWSGNYRIPSSVSGQESDHYSLDLLWLLGVPFYSSSPDPLDVFHPSVALGKVLAGDSEFIGTNEPGPNGAQKFFRVALAIIDAGTTDPDSKAMSLTGILYRGSPAQDVTDGVSALGASRGVTQVFWDGVSYGAGDDNLSLRAALSAASERLDQFPGYRNRIVAYTHVGLGLSPSMPAFSFEITALSHGTDADMGTAWSSPENARKDADPAAVIYDLLTSPWGKLSLPADAIDRASFEVASATLFTEGNGYSILIDQRQDASEIINDVLRQIDGVLYPEPTTGKLVLRLIRADYDVSQLRDINPDNATPASASWYSIQSWSELPTQVRLTWTNRDNNYNEAPAVAQNGAAAIAQGRTLRSVSIRFVGCCDPANAQRLVSRELAAVSIPMAKVSIVVDRSFYTARLGSVYTFTWPELGIDHMAMRVARVDFGQLHDGKITLDMIRDAFDVSLGGFGTGSGSGSGSGIAA